MNFYVIWTALLITAVILGGILLANNPQQKQNPLVIEQYQASQLDVFAFSLKLQTKDQIIASFKKNYPNYEIVKIYISKKKDILYIEAKRK